MPGAETTGASQNRNASSFRCGRPSPITIPSVARTPIQRTTENFPIAPIRRMRSSVTATHSSDATGASHLSGISGKTKWR